MPDIAEKVRIQQDNDGMLRRALERIIQLYTDKSHFVYELLQNAEDARATKIRFIQYNDRLEVLHDGKPFTMQNLQGLCDIGKSDKADNLNQIGEFGVGFKSVFGICETVRLYSIPANYRSADVDDAIAFSIEIHDFTRPVDIPSADIPSEFTTKFIFPYAVGKSFTGFNTISQLNTTLSQKLQNLGITTLLFMKHLELIEYSIETGSAPIEGQYLLEKKTVNEHCEIVSAIGIDRNKQSKHDEIISYLKFSRAISGMLERSVDIAFPVTINSEGIYECQRPKNPYVSVYFPTETESKLDFIVQGPYRTTPNRSSIPADDADNIKFAKETADLLRDSLIELRDKGILNMSFFKILPLSENSFENFDLFKPLYDTTKHLLGSELILPCNVGGYVHSKNAKIARQEKLATILPDEVLTDLIHNGQAYRWLPTFLTETNKEYLAVHQFLISELKVPVIRPEDLRSYFESNPDFLPSKSDDWLVELYSIYENIPGSFSRTRNENNLLTANIIKTNTGKFVSAYRRTENRQFIPNVFIPTNTDISDLVNFVDESLYNRCRHFFDDIVGIQKPNFYELQINDIKKRYSGEHDFNEQKYIDDLKVLLKYHRNDDYKDEINSVIREYILLRCNDGQMRNAYLSNIFIPLTEDGINIEAYFKGIVSNVYYVDSDFYSANGIPLSELAVFGVKNSLAAGENQTSGSYNVGGHGRAPQWYTSGDFRWKFTLVNLKDVLKYISAHPTAKDSILKSQAIFRILINCNEKKIRGNVYIGGATPDLHDEPCELIKTLRGSIIGWDGKWLFTDANDLVSPKSVSKYDISQYIYGSVKTDSIVYEILGFKKTEADEADELRRSISQSQLDAFFESELKNRFGVSSEDLDRTFGQSTSLNGQRDEEKYTFPISNIKNLESLKKHAAEVLCYANPVKYDQVVRSIRVSNRTNDVRAYLHNMYRYDGVYKYACQICHEPTGSTEIAQLFNEPEFELDQMNLCLCPNCAAIYRTLRSNSDKMAEFRRWIIQETDITSNDQIVYPINEYEIWFTQVHFAEIQELLRLQEEVKQHNLGGGNGPIKPVTTDEKSGMQVYDEYIGKTIRKRDGNFEGVVTGISDGWLVIDVSRGSKAGQTTKIQLKFILKDKNYYEFE